MQRVNLLYVITKLELGGAQKQLLGLISHLDKKRYNPSLISAQQGFLVHRVSSIKELKFVKSQFLERSVKPIKDFLALFQIYSFIKKNNIDIVHTHSSKAGILGRWAAKLAGVKIIIHTVHGWSFNEYQNPFWRRIIIWLERLTALIIDKLIVVSYHDLKKGLENHIGNKEKYRLIRYGIDYIEFSNRVEGLRETLGISAQDLLIGMIACFKPQKSPQDFIKLAYLVSKAIPHTKFLLVGDGILRRQIERLISEYNLEQQVILTGWREDILRILSAIDIFVLTSLWEGLPISVLEAMAASRPVVVTNTGGITEIIAEGKNGFLVSQGDINKLAERVIELLKDNILRNQIGQNARNSLGYDFTLENMVRHAENLYQDLIKQKTIRSAN
jgi:glycosyltransferase involved in cell wall biosynthesis